jgi:hypothetical protein
MTDQLRRTVERNSLRYSVSREIFCPVTGEVLDVRRAVEVTVLLDGKVAAVMVMAASAWDDREESARAALARSYPMAEVEVLDGRVLFGHPATGDAFTVVGETTYDGTTDSLD